jgi:hypothetical protein
MRRLVCLLAVLILVGFAGCGTNPQPTGVSEKPKPQVMTVDEFFADTNKDERDLRLVGILKSWKGNPGQAFGSSDVQATIAGEKGKTCSVFVPEPGKTAQTGEDSAPKVGKWVIVDVRGSNKPFSRTNGEFTKGTLLPGTFETQEEALKAANK